MKAIILSAGQGKRLLPLTAHLPKCLLQVQGKSILEWQLDTLLACGITDITVVVGYQADQVEAVLHEKYRQTAIHTLLNAEFASTDNLVSCWLARAEMHEDFILLNGDTLFEPAILRQVLEEAHAPVTVTVNEKNGYDSDDMKVCLAADRLLRIVLDNTNRVERIVSDVLELGRRDRAHRELIDLRQTLRSLVDEYTAKERIATDVVRIEISGEAKICFDRAHFYQVLGNLLGNALRHSRKSSGSVRLRVSDSEQDGGIDLHVVDDGPGVDEATREHIFEPFFTTHSRGTGLGLYIARELCEANAAQLELKESEAGADFCISGRFDECQ